MIDEFKRLIEGRDDIELVTVTVKRMRAFLDEVQKLEEHCNWSQQKLRNTNPNELYR